MRCFHRYDHVHISSYVYHKIEKLVTNDYILVYFHGATPKHRTPDLKFLRKCYQMINFRYETTSRRKNSRKQNSLTYFAVDTYFETRTRTLIHAYSTCQTIYYGYCRFILD
jgi:hypothetical protein